ncbi:MAG: hypothetical protein RBJ76_13515 [Stenomitos frigidus ULC029]
MASHADQNKDQPCMERLHEGGRVIFASRGVLPKTAQLTHTLRILSLTGEAGKPPIWRLTPDLTHHCWLLYRLHDAQPLVLLSLQFGLGSDDLAKAPNWIAAKIGTYLSDRILPDLPSLEFGQYIYYADPINKQIQVLDPQGRLRKFAGRVQNKEDRELIEAAKQQEKRFATTRIQFYAEAIDRMYKIILRK